jgi:polyisoprenyl-teichoic acid--peptidoglycan teichoic acid transferase
VHARRIRPATGHLDRRRLAAAGLSAIVPGLGQALNGRRRLTWFFLVPSLVVGAIVLLLLLTQSPARLTAWAIAPSVLGFLLVLNVLFLVWRLLAAGQAFIDTRWVGPTGRLGVVGMLVIALLIVVPHLVVWRYGTALEETFGRVFSGTAPGVGVDGQEPPEVRGLEGERLNVLLVGVDAVPWRTTTLTDAMLVVSVDPVGGTVSMLSVPRDLVNVPLGNGNVFGPKLNSLMSYADRNPDEFPTGGMTALLEAVGALLEIEIPYFARIDLLGFIDLVDAVGGVEVTVDKGFEDPEYISWGGRPPGWSITAGTHRLDGRDALAYARARRGDGESDFTRAGRQQEILIALRNEVTRDGSLLWELPELLGAIGDMVTTNVPVGLLPDLAVTLDEIEDGGVVRSVIRHPLVTTQNTRYGYSLVPDVAAIRAVAAELFPEPGEEPQPWPTPTPAPSPRATPNPGASAP